jgi:hypothetical protein
MANKTKAPNKSEFVRRQPTSLSAAEVVAKAKAAGIALTAGHVYTIRAANKRKSGATKAGSGRRPASLGRPSAASTREREFVALVLELGLAQSEAMLARIRSRIGSAVG